MDMWGRLNKGLQVVQNQLDTYVEAAGVATPDEGATDSTATSGSAAAPDDVQQEKAQGATPEKTGRFEDLQEALEQSENRNRLINEEFSLLLRQKDKEIQALKESSESGVVPDAITSAAAATTSSNATETEELRQALSEKEERLQELESKSEQKLTRLKQQAKAKITGLQEQVSSLQEQLKQFPATDSPDGGMSVTGEEVENLRACLEESTRRGSELQMELEEVKKNASMTATVANSPSTSEAEETVAQLTRQLQDAEQEHTAARRDWEKVSTELRAAVSQLEQKITEKEQHAGQLASENASQNSRIEQLEEKIAEKLKEIEELEEQDVASQAEIMSLQAEMSTTANGSSVDGHDLQQVQTELAEKAHELESLQDRNEQLTAEMKQQHASLTEQIDSITSDKSDLEVQVAKLLADIQVRDEQLSSNSSDLAEQLRTEQSKLESEHNQLESNRSQLLSERNKLESDHVQLQSERSQLEAERSHLQSELGQLGKERSQLQSECTEFEAARSQLQSERGQLEAERNSLEVDRNGLAAERNSLEVDRSGLEAERNSLEVNRSGLEAERNSLEVDRSGLEAERKEFSSQQSSTVAELTEDHERKQSALQLQLEQLREEFSIQTDQLQQELSGKVEQVKALQSDIERQQQQQQQRGKVQLSTSATSVASDQDSAITSGGSSSCGTAGRDVQPPSTPTRPAGAMTDSWTPLGLSSQMSTSVTVHDDDVDVDDDADPHQTVERLRKVLEAKEQALKDLNAKAEVKFEKLKAQAKKKLSSLQHQHAAEKEELVQQWQQRLDKMHSEHTHHSDSQSLAATAGSGKAAGGNAGIASTGQNWEKLLEERLSRIQELEQTAPSLPEAATSIDVASHRPIRLADLKQKCEQLSAENVELLEKVEALSVENTDLMALLSESRRTSKDDTSAQPDPQPLTADSEEASVTVATNAGDSIARDVSQDMTTIANEVDKKLNAALSSVATFLVQVKEHLNTDDDDNDDNGDVIEYPQMPTEHESMSQSVSELCQVAQSAHRKRATLLEENMRLSMNLSSMQQSLRESQLQLSDVAETRDESAGELETLQHTVQSLEEQNADLCAQLTELEAMKQRNVELHTQLQSMDTLEQDMANSLQKLSDQAEQVSSLQAQLDKVTRQLHTKQEECDETAAERLISENELSSVRAELHTANTSKEAAQQQLTTAQQQLTTAQQQLATTGQDLESTEQKLASTEQELQAKSEHLNTTTSKCLQLEVNVKELQVQCETIETERHRQSSAERSGLVDELRLWRNKAEDAEAQVSKTSSQLADLQLSWSEQNGVVSTLQRQLQDCERQSKALSHEAEKLRADYKDSQAQLNTVLGNLHAAQASAAQQLSSSQSEEKRLHRQFTSLQAQLKQEEEQRRRAEHDSAKLSEEKEKAERLYADLHSQVANQTAQRNEENVSILLLQQQVTEAEAARQKLQLDLDMTLTSLHDRETQTLQLSSEVARLTAQRGDVEQQMRQVGRQRDLAQAQEDQIRSQLLLAQSAASTVPELQSQLEASASHLRETSRKLQDSEAACSAYTQTVKSLREQCSDLEADQQRRESEVQMEMRSVQLRQRQLEQDLELATVERRLQASADAAKDQEMADLTESTVLIPLPVDSEDYDKLQQKLTAESAKCGILERELDDSRQEVQELLKEQKLQQEETQQLLQQHRQQQRSADVAVDVAETEDIPEWSSTLTTDGAGQSAQSTTLPLAANQLLQQLRVHSLGLTHRLSRAHPGAPRMLLVAYAVFIHFWCLYCAVA
ncbi:myosin-6-like isoform X2 [Sycon ciliatum]|uniref:myosin-6-like isoform X2 n=1 Tax=Sycon ciliatum TaxID=27933 RepID=UPI0031F673F9